MPIATEDIYQPLASVGEDGPRLRVTNAGLHERSPEGIGMRSGSVKSSSPENTDARPAQGQYVSTLCWWGVDLLTPAMVALYRRRGLSHGGGEPLFCEPHPKPRHQLRLDHLEEVSAPRPGPIPPIAANRSAGPHSGDAHPPFRRSGQLPAVARNAPVASTPPGRRDPGR